jgi:hypothetical protein
MSESIIKSTIEVLRPYFTAMPFMDEKYFSRPPIKFLILTVAGIAQVRKGFLSGLFTPTQLKGDLPDRHEKHSFFVVLKRYVELLIGEPVDVRARAIITGQEVDKTLLFLQMIVRAAENPVIPFGDALKQVKPRMAQSQPVAPAQMALEQFKGETTLEELREENRAALAEVARLRDAIRQKDDVIERLKTTAQTQETATVAVTEIPGCHDITKMNAFKFDKVDLPGRCKLSKERSIRRFKPTDQ